MTNVAQAVKAVVGKNQQVVGSSPSAGSISFCRGDRFVLRKWREF